MMLCKKVLPVLVFIFGDVLGNVQFPGPIFNDPNVTYALFPATKKAAGKPEASIASIVYIAQLQTQGPISKPASDLHEEFHIFAKRDTSIDYTASRQKMSSESIFFGLSLALKAGDVENLKGIKNVAGLWNVEIVTSPSSAIRRAPLPRRYATVPIAGTNCSLPYISGDLDLNRPHTMTGVDKVHDAGIKGKEIKISIIDTAVDHRYPSLGG
jgi:hypothetical protein